MNSLVTGGSGVSRPAPGDGVGAVERTVYSAEIVGSAYSPAGLIEWVCEHPNDFLGGEIAAGPGTAPEASFRAERPPAGFGPARGPLSLQLVDRADLSATFAAAATHSPAGLVAFAAERETPGIRFVVEVTAQPATVLDWVAMHTVGTLLQHRDWRSVVRAVVEASGGTAPAGIQQSREKLDEEDLRVFTKRLRVHGRAGPDADVDDPSTDA